MKKLLLPLTLLALTHGLMAGGTPGGPWGNGAYYPGYLNGKYMGVVTGNNISGVLGFAIFDGAPPWRTQESQQAAAGGLGPSVVAVNQTIIEDYTQNYFAIFVEGRTYAGITTAGIDIASKTVAGALQGQIPPALLDPPDNLVVNPANGINAFNALSVINRGLSGGFTAKVKCDKAVFTFKGDGQLSTPANKQSYQIESQIIGLPAAQTNAIISGIYETETTPFQVKGIRTSFSASSLQGALDRNAASAGTSAGGGN